MTVSISKNEHGRMTLHVSMGYSYGLGDGNGTFFSTEVSMDEILLAMVNAGYSVEPVPAEK